MRFKLIAPVAAAVVGMAGIMATASPADAQYRHHRHHHRHHHNGAGAAAGFFTGALIGSALAPRYYGPPVYASDAVAYCSRKYKSYDPASGTYLGYDGYRHACP